GFWWRGGSGAGGGGGARWGPSTAGGSARAPPRHGGCRNRTNTRRTKSVAAGRDRGCGHMTPRQCRRYGPAGGVARTPPLSCFGDYGAAASAGLRRNSLRKNAAPAASATTSSFFSPIKAASNTLKSPAFAATPPAINAAIPYSATLSVPG